MEPALGVGFWGWGTRRKGLLQGQPELLHVPAQPWAAPVLPQKAYIQRELPASGPFCRCSGVEHLQPREDHGQEPPGRWIEPLETHHCAVGCWHLPSAHSSPLSPCRFGHGQGTQAEPGQAGPEAAARQQPLPVSAGGGAVPEGTQLGLGTVPRLAPLLPPAFPSSLSNCSSCLPTLVGGVCRMFLPHPVLSDHHLATQVAAGGLAGSCPLCVASGTWTSPFPIQRHRERSRVPWLLCLLQMLMLAAVLACKCHSLGDRHPCRSTWGWQWS